MKFSHDLLECQLKFFMPGTHILWLLIFRCLLKQIRAATQHSDEARQTHDGSNATLQLRRGADFFRETRMALCYKSKRLTF